MYPIDLLKVSTLPSVTRVIADAKADKNAGRNSHTRRNVHRNVERNCNDIKSGGHAVVMEGNIQRHCRSRYAQAELG